MCCIKCAPGGFRCLDGTRRYPFCRKSHCWAWWPTPWLRPARAGPVAPEAGRVVQVRGLDELALDEQGHDETEPVGLQVPEEPGRRHRCVVPAGPRCVAPGVVGPLTFDDRSMPAAGDIPEHRVPRAGLVHPRRAMLAVFEGPVTGDVISPRLVQGGTRADPLDPEQVRRPRADVVGQGLHPEVVATVADATVSPERPAARAKTAPARYRCRTRRWDPCRSERPGNPRTLHCAASAWTPRAWRCPVATGGSAPPPGRGVPRSALR